MGVGLEAEVEVSGWVMKVEVAWRMGKGEAGRGRRNSLCEATEV